MSKLNFMDSLLAGVVADFKYLGDICKIETGKLNANAAVENGEYLFFTTAKEVSRINKYRWDAEALLIAGNANVGEVKHYIGRFEAYQRTYVLTDFNKNLNVRYLYFVLTNYLKKYLEEKTNSAAMTYIVLSTLQNFPIPIPCPDNPKKSLEIQAEIVRILDAFTAHTAELTAELTARKKQYNYYRDKLLSFEDGEVEWKTLGDITKRWYSGSTPTAGRSDFYDNGSIPWLRTQEVKFTDIYQTEVKVTDTALSETSIKWIPENCVIIAISGATAGRSAINKIPLTTNQHCGCLEVDSSKALYRYVFHWVSFNYENIKSLGQGARGDLNSSIIKGFKIPIPCAQDPERSLNEQARIVKILDSFNVLTTSISEGLPREIELRQKQYEYYRDLLLSFPKPQAAAVSA